MSDWFERFGFGEVADGLLTGAYPLDAADVAALRAAGVSCVFNLCEDVEYEEGRRAAVAAELAAAGIAEQRLGVEDFGGLKAEALESSVEAVLAWLDAGETVYLHCRAGWQRSATVATGVVALREGIALDEALGAIRRRRPSALPLHHQLEDLHRWWRARGGSVRRGA